MAYGIFSNSIKHRWTETTFHVHAYVMQGKAIGSSSSRLKNQHNHHHHCNNCQQTRDSFNENNGIMQNIPPQESSIQFQIL